MPSDFASLKLMELEDALLKNLINLQLSEASNSLEKKTVGFQRRCSTFPETLSKLYGGSTDYISNTPAWPLKGLWGRETELPQSSLSQTPWRLERSVSMIDGRASGFNASHDVPQTCASPARPSSAVISSRYKTELCRTFEESGTCKYGEKCQFAHGMEELRGLSRHPKYKTELCRTYHTVGFCPYGTRCHFIHNAEEQRLIQSSAMKQQRQERPQLRQSVSFGGFPSGLGFQLPLEPPAFSRTSSVSPPPSAGSPKLHSPVLDGPPGLCKDKQGQQPAPLFLAAVKSGFFGHSATCSPGSCAAAGAEKSIQHQTAFSLPGLSTLMRTSSEDSLSDQDSCSSQSDSESPAVEAGGKRLPIFSRMSVSD